MQSFNFLGRLIDDARNDTRKENAHKHTHINDCACDCLLVHMQLHKMHGKYRYLRVRVNAILIDFNQKKSIYILLGYI